MKTLTIIRSRSQNTGTFGVAKADSYTWHSLELPWKDNANRVSCIPAGIYMAYPFHSPTKGDVYLLKDVPGRSMVEIHPGNWGGDTSKGYKSDFLGCIGLGESLGVVMGQNGIMQSKAAIAEFLQWADRQPVKVDISWDAGQDPESEPA